jgi:hypothetical protein
MSGHLRAKSNELRPIYPLQFQPNLLSHHLGTNAREFCPFAVDGLRQLRGIREAWPVAQHYLGQHHVFPSAHGKAINGRFRAAHQSVQRLHPAALVFVVEAQGQNR